MSEQAQDACNWDTNDKASWSILPGIYVSQSEMSIRVIGLYVLFSIMLIRLLRLEGASWYYNIRLLLEYVLTSVPLIEVEMTPAESSDDFAPSSEDQIKTNNDDGNSSSSNILGKSGYIQCYDPSTGQYLDELKSMTASDIHEICVKAKAAQETWKLTSYPERRKVLRTIQKYICAHVEDICRVCTRDSGKPKIDALLGEILTTCEKIRCINANGELWLAKDYRTTGPMMMHKIAYVQYVPYGIIAPIAPWNYPFHNMMNHIISGIFAGNAVVGKVSEHTSWSSQYFGRIVQTALKVNGHDPNLVQTIVGGAEAGNALVSEPLVNKIIFTGSPNIGRKVMKTASDHLKPVILELGGKDPMVLMDGIKPETIETEIIPWVLRGCYQNCGQNCVGVERVFVYEKIYDEFIKKIVPKVKALRQGIPLETYNSDANVDCGSMVMEAQLTHVQTLIDDAVQKGANLHCGGTRNVSVQAGSSSIGQYYHPTVLSDVTPEMKIFHTEVFGPVMTIIKVPGNDDDECVRLVNHSEFGLGSSVYNTSNANRALQVGERFETGMLTVNDFASNYLVQSLPFGGCKDSGFGRFAGIEGLRSLCIERSIVIDKFPTLVKTSIPPPINYPIQKEKGLPFGTSLIQLFYNESWISKIVSGIVGLIKHG